MVKVYLNPGKLDEKLAAIDNFSGSVRSAYNAIKGYYTNDPIRGDLGSCLATFGSAGDDLLIQTGKIRKIKTNIEQLNSSGVASSDVDGGISFEVPDDSDGLESPEKFQKWAQGAMDASDLKYMASHRDGSFKLPSGREASEVIESLKTEKEDPTYANSFVDTVGAEKLVDLPSAAKNAVIGKVSNKSVEKSYSQLFGSLLATASQTWGKDKSESMSDKIVSSVTSKEGAGGNICYLNEMFRGSDSDQNHINDLVFGKDFLVSMGDRLERIPWENNRKKYDRNAIDHSYVANGWSFDPLSGVLDAMGNNPEAAVQFLAPYDHDRSTYDDGGPKADTSRLDRLFKRDWEPDGYSGLTGAIAAASSMRASDSAAMRESADQIAGRSIHFLGQNSTTSSIGKRDLYDMPDTKARVGMLLANCAPEITEAWNEGTSTDVVSKKQLPAASVDDFDRLTYQVSDDADATATISAGLAEYSRNRSQEGIAKKAGDPDGQLSAINEAYRRGGNAVNYLAGIADARAGEINDEKEREYSTKSANASAAVNVFFDVAKTGLESLGGPVTKVMVSPITKAATPAVKTLVTPVIVKGIVGEREKEVFSPVDKDASLNMRAAAIRDAANADLLKQDDFKESGALASKFAVKNGDKYRIDLSRGATARDVITWENSVTADSGDPAFAKLRNDSRGEGAAARTSGWDAAERVRKNPR